MKPSIKIATVLTLAALTAGAHLSAQAAGGPSGQDNPFEKLKTYDFQTYAPVDAIRRMILDAQSDKAKTADIEQHLVSVLEDTGSTFAGKQEACRLLWIIGSARSVPALSKLLVDEKQSDIARYALERNPDPSAGKALRSALSVVKGKTLIGVINSVGDRGDAEAVGALKGFAVSSDPMASEAAIAALGKIGTESALSALRAVPGSSLFATRASLRIASHFASTGKKAEALKIYDGLIGEGRPAVVRGEALRGLAGLQSPHTASVALAFMKTSDPYLQEVGARIAASMLDPQTTKSVLSAYSTVPPMTQTILLTALAERGEASAAVLAESSTQSPDPQVRTAAIRALAQIGGGKAVPVLVKIARQGEGDDRRTARESLASMPGNAAEQAILQTALKGEAADRALLMGILAERPSPAVTVALLEAARGADTATAVEAARALGRTGGVKEHGELLKIVLSTQSDDIRDAAKDGTINIARRMGNPDLASTPVLAALPTASGPAKASLLAILTGTGGDRALEELTRAANSQDATVKQAAVGLLAESWTDTRPLPTLLSVVKTSADKSLRVQAARGYLRLVGEADRQPAEQKVKWVAQLLPVVERPEERRQALSILRDCRVSSSMEQAAALLDDSAVSSDAADAVLYLAAQQEKGRGRQPAVKGPATDAALDKIIRTTGDSKKKLIAQKIKG